MSIADEVKDRIDIVEIVSPYVELKKSGRNLKGNCPFHGEKTPSFYIYPEDGSYHCFGCGAHGSAIDFMMKKEGMSYGDALRNLADRAGVAIPERIYDPVQAEKSSRLRDASEAAARFFAEQLRRPEGAAALAYLEERGIDKATIDSFALGYAPERDTLLRYLIGLGFQKPEIVEAGLALERDDGAVRDRFWNRLIVPIRDRDGKTIAFGARALLPDQQPKYVNSPDTDLFTKGNVLYGLDKAAKAIREQDRAVIVEGYMDAITAHKAGFENVVASMGTALTDRQARQLMRLTKRIVLALDADAAGRDATIRGLAVVQEASDEVVVPTPTWRGYIRYVGRNDVNLRVLTLPIGKDPDELIKRDPGLWKELVENAKPVVEHLFATMLDGADLNEPAAKAAAADTLMPAIEALGDPIRQSHYLNLLATRLGVTAEALVNRRRRTTLPRTNRIAPPAAGEPKAEARPLGPDERKMEHYALSLLYRFPEIPSVEIGFEEELLEGSAERQLFRDRGQNDEMIDPLLAELRERILNQSLPEMNADDARKALRQVIGRLSERQIRRRILGGGAAAETPEQLESTVDAGGRLVAVWKSREEGGKLDERSTGAWN